MRLGIRALAVTGALLLATGCQVRLALWIMPGSRDHDLVFGDFGASQRH